MGPATSTDQPRPSQPRMRAGATAPDILAAAIATQGTSSKRDKALTAIRAGATRQGAASTAGVSRRTLYDWITKDETYAALVEEAETYFETVLMAQIRKAGNVAEVIETFDARGNLLRRVEKYDWRASAWIAEHHPALKQRWAAPSKVEVTGADGGPIEMTGAVEFRPDPAWIEAHNRALAELPVEVRPAPIIVEGESREVSKSTS